MANIKKSFNFRNGVQVDDDNLKVSPLGLVGIGTTIPTEALDVRGNLSVSGVSSASVIQAGVLTVTTFNPTSIIGAGISVVSGVVTASSGIVTYYGDARFLQGMPTSQWEDVNTGFGVSSIYNTGGNVGIATSNPQFTLQVGANVNSNKDGVGISSFGDIKVSGIITATSFTGNITGNVNGNVTGNVTGEVTGNSTGNLTGLVNSSGISTFGGINATGSIVGAVTSNVIPFFYSNLSDLPSAVTYHGAFAHVHATGKGYYAHGGNWIELVNKDTSGNVSLSGDLDVDGHTNLDNVSVSGVSTFNGSIITNGSVNATGNLDVDGHANLDNVNIAGVTTFSGAINADGGASIDNIQIGVTGDNEIDTSTGNLTIDSSGGTTTIDDNLTISGETNAVNVVASGVITATTELNSPLIGVGTDTPANAIQVRKTGNVEIQITSDTGAAGLTVGREAGLNNTNNGEFRYGGGGGFPYSSDQSLDIINYGTGNFNYHLSANNAGSTAGNFFWHKGSSNVRLMTLTNSGRLGIGLTEPTDELHVAGGATVDGALAVGGNINVTGTLVGNVQGTLTGNVSGTLAGNSNTTVGISTFNNISVAGIATIQNQRSANLSIGDNPQVDKLLKVFISGTQQVFVNDVGQVGILTTTSLPGVGINASSTNMSVAAIGVGVTQFDNGAVNLSNAGLSTNRFMVPPTVTTTQRNNLVGLISGAMIYNTSINKLQVYTGSAWETITSS